MPTHACECPLLQAVIGIAFSLGFLFGPMIGAGFSILGRSQGEMSFTMFQYPALFSLCMAALSIVIILTLFKETLPLERRVRSKDYQIAQSGHGALYSLISWAL